MRSGQECLLQRYRKTPTLLTVCMIITVWKKAEKERITYRKDSGCGRQYFFQSAALHWRLRDIFYGEYKQFPYFKGECIFFPTESGARIHGRAEFLAISG